MVILTLHGRTVASTEYYLGERKPRFVLCFAVGALCKEPLVMRLVDVTDEANPRVRPLERMPACLHVQAGRQAAFSSPPSALRFDGLTSAMPTGAFQEGCTLLGEVPVTMEELLASPNGKLARDVLPAGCGNQASLRCTGTMGFLLLRFSTLCFSCIPVE